MVGPDRGAEASEGMGGAVATIQRRGPVRCALVGLAAGVMCVLSSCSASSESPATPGEPAARTGSQLPPAATTPVPPPTPGSTASSVPSQRVVRRQPVSLDSSGKSADGVDVTLSLSAVQAQAQGPGEVSGPAVKVVVTIDNTTSDLVGLQDASVTVTGSDDAPGQIMSGPPSAPLPASVPTKERVTGVYVFALASKQRDPMTVEVTVSPSVPVAVFRGVGPR